MNFVSYGKVFNDLFTLALSYLRCLFLLETCRFSLFLHYTIHLITMINLRFVLCSCLPMLILFLGALCLSCINLSGLMIRMSALQLAARSPEEAAGWIRSLMEAALKVCLCFQSCCLAFFYTASLMLFSFL